MASRIGTGALTHGAALLTLAWFSYRTLLPAWSFPSSDFPNYYTAAQLARSRVPLHFYYDWTWFQRAIHIAGIDGQLGGYIPQTPLTLLPFVPLSPAPAAEARKIWLAMNCGFLGISLWLLTRITSLNLSQLWLISFLSGDALRNNFLLGQYYLFLLMLLTGAAYCLVTKRDRWAGALTGLALVLKLYGGPLLLLLVAKRRWKSVAAFAAICLLAACGCILWFGFEESLRYCTQVLPRSLGGETLNPFHASNNTMATLLRRAFMKEEELNPHPWISDSPLLFFLCRTMFTASVLVLTWLGSTRCSERLALAWWLIASLLVSPNTASYTFVLPILPVALLFDEIPFRRWLMVLATWMLIALPLRPEWSCLFPRLWFLMFLYSLIGCRCLQAIPRRRLIAAFATVMVVGVCAGLAGAVGVRLEPAAHFARVAPESGAIYSNSPALSRKGLTYESIGNNRYVIRSGDKTIDLPGDAFHPAVPDSGTPVYFESVQGMESKIMSFDPDSGQLAIVPTGITQPERPAVSHDGRTLAFISAGKAYVFDGSRTRSLELPGSVSSVSFAPGDNGIVFAALVNRRYTIGRFDPVTRLSAVLLSGESELAGPSLSFDGRLLVFSELTESGWQVDIKVLATSRQQQITGGRCNNTSPAWYPVLHHIVFASDCGRGLGLPALYRTGPLDDIGNIVPEPLDAKPPLPFAPAVR